MSMKKIIRALVFILFLYGIRFILEGQTNLVQNPSFETYLTCPTTLGDYEASNWWVSSQTPDYFNSCANTYTNGCSGVPYNGDGFQQAFQGNAYSGVCTMDYNVTSNYRDYISSKLTTTLNIGTKYYFSMQIASGVFYDTVHYCSQGINGATNKIGALFTTYKGSGSNYLQPKNFAHIFETTIVTDTANWTQVKGSFIADSAYQYINLGNFFDDNNTDTLRVYIHPNWVNPAACVAYYYVDEVVLSTDSTLLAIEKNALIENCAIYPNPISNNYFFVKSTLDIQSVSVFNHLGQQVKIVFHKQQDGTIRIELEGETEKGLFVLQVISKNKTYHYTIIKN